MSDIEKYLLKPEDIADGNVPMNEIEMTYESDEFLNPIVERAPDKGYEVGSGDAITPSEDHGVVAEATPMEALNISKDLINDAPAAEEVSKE
ncbi:MAG: hypothetical protein WC307_06170 [Candidatus Nanoarchaeia archaeon]|jgi:hypothetical protein